MHFSDPWYRTDRCVDELLYWGKVLYIMEQCMPDAQSGLVGLDSRSLGLG